jgi:DNA damage-binding protein 1
MFHSDHTAPRDARGFIDGDLVEQFLDLKKGAAEEVAGRIEGVTLEDLTKLVEDLARLTA